MRTVVPPLAADAPPFIVEYAVAVPPEHVRVAGEYAAHEADPIVPST
jgi:hypothetical protein